MRVAAGPRLLIMCFCRCCCCNHSLSSYSSWCFISTLCSSYLDFQGKARAKNASRKSKEGDAEHGAEAGNQLPLPRLRHCVPVAHRAQRDQTPPEGVGKTCKLVAPCWICHVFLHQKHNKGAEDENKEADVKSGDQLLSVSIDDRTKKLPCAT